MINLGATTLWETWSFPERYASQNHPMFGSISEWFYKWLLGITPLTPGFQQIRIKPTPAGDLQWAKGHYKSVRGKIFSHWKFDGNEFILEVEVPVNTTAEVWIPATKDAVVTESNTVIHDSPTFSPKRNGNHMVVTIGSGRYQFKSTNGKI
jgi:alpha-L-rhamnosidase